MKATYWDHRVDQIITGDISDIDDAIGLMGVIAGLETPNGRTALELEHDSGSTLVWASDNERAVLSWLDALGGSHHSVGGRFSENLEYDYFGSWSEAPGAALVAFTDSVDAVRSFLSTGSPVTPEVLFLPDW